jgi:hypothetical protein
MSKVSLSLLALSLTLAGCDSGPLTDDDSDILDAKNQRHQKMGNLFGDEIFVFGGNNEKTAEAAGITVNEFLWRASLDTVSFMPLRTVDPFGGVILTEWYTPTGSHNERLKVDVFVLDRQLRSNGIRVAIHKQVFNGSTKAWIDQKVNPKTVNDFEEAILTRARQLKVNSKVK